MTSSFNKGRVLVRIALNVAGLAAVVAGSVYVQWLLSLDPFARFRSGNVEDIGPDVGIRLEDVQVRTYSGPKLVAAFQVDRVDIRKDRSRFSLFGVKDGAYYGADDPLRFQCLSGSYDSGMRRFEGSDGARVWNADFDLEIDAFSITQASKKLFVPGHVKGRFYDGTIALSRLDYFPETGFFEAGPGTWKGEVELPAQGKKTEWTIRQAKSGKRKDDEIRYVEVDATDGEVVIKAPEAVLNTRTDVLVATGRVRYFGIDANVICDKVTVFRKEKRTVLEGNVTMLVKPEEGQKLEEIEIPPYTPTVPDEIAKNRPKPTDTDAEKQKKIDDEIRSTKSMRQYPIVIHAGKIEYWYAKGTRRAEVTGSPEAYQAVGEIGWRRVWGPKAFYNAEDETLKMQSTEGKKDTRFQTSVGDDMVCDWFLVSTKKGDEDNWEGSGLQGKVVVHEDEDRPTKSGQNPPPGAKTPPPGTKTAPLKGTIGGSRRR